MWKFSDIVRLLTRVESLWALGGLIIGSGALSWLWKQTAEIGWPASILLGIGTATVVMLVLSALLVSLRYFRPIAKTIRPETKVKNALELILTHTGELGGESYTSSASSTINDHLVNYINEPDTQLILKVIKHGCYSVGDASRISVSQDEKTRIQEVIRECCRLMLDNFDKRPSQRDNACREFIQKRKETLPQGPTDTEAGKPQ
jgi:hypothetical protein